MSTAGHLQHDSGSSSQQEGGYQSLHTLDSRRRTPMDSSAPGGRAGLGKADGAPPPQRSKIAKMVRMASEVLIGPSGATSGTGHHPKPKNYGTVAPGEESAVADDADDDEDDFYDDWTQFRFILLTIGLAGAQFAWTIELGYGTPYLLSLGLSKELTSLVWLAGPLSGFIVQPLIGALSDNSSSRFRRRRWVVYSTVCIVLSTLILAFAGEMARWIVDLFARGEGDWDPQRNSDIRLTRIILAVAAFYILDFSLNACQAALRALVLDLVPSDQQTAANAYIARMGVIGNIIGYGFGYINLGSTVLFKWIGGGQFRKLCMIGISVLLITIVVTCTTNHEERLPKIKRNKSLKAVFANIVEAVKDLPIPIRRICYVQVFAWSGWFPVLFYSTTWVGIRYKLQYPDSPPSDDTATRAGSLSLLFQSIIAVLASVFLPAFYALGSSEFVLNKAPSKFWNVSRWFLTWFTPRNIWTASHVFFTLVLASTFLVKNHEDATVIVALLGISWAVTSWVPFAILMEYIREMEAGAELGADEVISASEIHERILEEEEAEGGASAISASHLSVPNTGRARRSSRSSQRSNRSKKSSRRSSIRSNRSGRYRAQKALTECRPLLEGDEEAQEAPPKEVGGTILGIHNLAIVCPQFIVALVAAAIFKISAAVSNSPNHHRSGLESGADVVWVLRFGGAMTIFAAILSRWVPAPPSETIYIQSLKEASNVHDVEEDI